MSNLQLLRIKAEKRMYLVEIRNAEGEVKEEWLERDVIDFISPGFIEREQPGCSNAASHSPIPPPPVAQSSVSYSPIPQSPVPQSSVSHSLVSHSLVSSSPVQETSSVVPPSADSYLICDHCRAAFKRRDHLKNHLYMQHFGGKLSVGCPNCRKTFGYKQNLTKHLRKGHNFSREKALSISTKVVNLAKKGKKGKKPSKKSSKKSAASKRASTAALKKKRKVPKRTGLAEGGAVPLGKNQSVSKLTSETKQLTIKLTRVEKELPDYAHLFRPSESVASTANKGVVDNDASAEQLGQSLSQEIGEEIGNRTHKYRIRTIATKYLYGQISNTFPKQSITRLFTGFGFRTSTTH